MKSRLVGMPASRRTCSAEKSGGGVTDVKATRRSICETAVILEENDHETIPRGGRVFSCLGKPGLC